MVDKKNVIYHQQGFMVFYYDHWAEAFFFPWNNINEDDFLKHNHLNGFRFNRDGLDYYKDNATTKIINHGIYPNSKTAEDSLKLIPIEVSYYWGDHLKFKKLKQQQVNIKYSFQDKKIDLAYTIYDDRYLLTITPIKK